LPYSGGLYMGLSFGIRDGKVCSISIWQNEQIHDLESLELIGCSVGSVGEVGGASPSEPTSVQVIRL